MEKLLEEQEKKQETEIATLKLDLTAEYEEKIRNINLAHENQLQHLKSEYHMKVNKNQIYDIYSVYTTCSTLRR